MTTSPNWSGASGPCRPGAEAPGRLLEWRPSRWLAIALAALGPLAAMAVSASALPPTVAWPVGVLAAAWGPWLARRELRKPRLQLRLRDGGAIEVDGRPVEAFQVSWRGALAFLSWRDGAGRRQHRAWWPDTLPPGARRELRLATPVENPARPTPSVAP